MMTRFLSPWLLSFRSFLFLSLLGLSLPMVAENAEKKDTLVRFETTLGNFTVRLYEDTPVHRSNFLGLVRSGFYEGILFHRVIPHFMAQAGDPMSRTAPQGALLGEGDVGYTLPAEVRFPQYFHRRGVLAAAREGDAVNPEYRSSGCQFYVVTGQRLTPLNFEEMRVAMEKKLGRAYPDSVVEAYYEQGGTPWLDGTYTIFGEVVAGMDVIEDITAAPRDANDRPFEDVRILRAVLVEP